MSDNMNQLDTMASFPSSVFGNQPIPNTCTWKMAITYSITITDLINNFFNSCISPYGHLGLLMGIKQWFLMIFSTFGDSSRSALYLLDLIKKNIYYMGAMGILVMAGTLRTNTRAVQCFTSDIKDAVVFTYYVFMALVAFLLNKIPSKSRMRLDKRIGWTLVYLLLMGLSVLAIPLLMSIFFIFAIYIRFRDG